MFTNNAFNKRLQMLREEFNLSKDEFAKSLNISYSTIVKYEAGERHPDFDMLVKIADYFNVSVDYLLGKTDIRKLETASSTPPHESITHTVIIDPNKYINLDDIKNIQELGKDYIELAKELKNKKLSPEEVKNIIENNSNENDEAVKLLNHDDLEALHDLGFDGISALKDLLKEKGFSKEALEKIKAVLKLLE